MWYTKLFNKFAATKQEYLQTLGIPDDIIAFITSQNEEIANRLIHHIRSNPQLSIADLQKVMEQYKPKQPQWTKQELDAAKRFQGDEKFYKWILNQLWQHRTTHHPEGGGGSYYDYSFGPLVVFIAELPLIYDWYNLNDDIPISDYSYESAVMHEKDWHASLHGQGEENYAPTQPESIVYGPQWKNPKFNEWTIQAVPANDLSCEGNKMDHCVGKYDDAVNKGRLRVFSLRDANNEPHATIGMDGNENNVKQLYGVGNSTPEPEYQAMIKEWFTTLGNVTSDDEITEPLENIGKYTESSDVELALKEQIEMVANKYDPTYGYLVIDDHYLLLANVDTPYDEITKAIEKYFRDDGYGGYTQDIMDIAKLLVEYCFILSREILKTKPPEKINSFSIVNLIKKTEKDVDEAIEQMHWYDDGVDESQLTEEEQQQLWDEKQNEWIEHSFPASFARMINTIVYNKYQNEYFQFLKIIEDNFERKVEEIKTRDAQNIQ